MDEFDEASEAERQLSARLGAALDAEEMALPPTLQAETDELVHLQLQAAVIALAGKLEPSADAMRLGRLEVLALARASALKVPNKRPRLPWFAWLSAPALVGISALLLLRPSAVQWDSAHAPTLAQEASTSRDVAFRGHLTPALPPRLAPARPTQAFLSAQASLLGAEPGSAQQQLLKLEVDREMRGYRSELLAQLEEPRP